MKTTDVRYGEEKDEEGGSKEKEREEEGREYKLAGGG
jgi:hypothetical protein